MSYSFSENKWGEKYIEDLNRTDFTTMKSADLFSKVLDFDLGNENTLYLLIGSDSGLILPYLKQQTLGRGSRIAVIEHDDVFPLVASEYRGLLAVDDANAHSKTPTISLHRHSTWCSEVFDGSEAPWLLGGQVRIVESNSSAVDYAHIYMPILRAAKISAEERVATISVTLNRKIFSVMQFKNAADSTTPIKSSVTFGVGKTAIVLGGGPSLDQHLDWITDNRDRLFILAVSRIAKKLDKHKIQPDLLISVDPLDLSYEICKSGVLWQDVPLVYNFHISSKLLQQWQGPRFYLGRRLPWHNKKQLTGFIAAAGPTVSHTATFVASQLGFSQILLTGVDLCYSASASTHADDSPEQMIQQMPSLCDARVQTYSGRTAGTSVLLKQSVDALEDIGKLVNRNETVLHNISIESARCCSIPYLALDDVELPDQKPDFSDHADTKVCAPSSRQLDELEKDIKSARHVFTNIRNLCSTAKKCVNQLHAPNVGFEAKKYSIRLTKIRKQLENDYPDHLGAIIYDKGLEFSKTKMPTDFKDMKPEELAEWGRHYYKLIESGARVMMDHIDELMPRIELRRDELGIDVNVRELAKRWKDDETPGRILLWKRLNWKRVQAKDRAWVQRSIGKFRATLNEPAALVKELLSGKNEDIDNVMKSLIFLSQSERMDELVSIEAKLDEHTWPYSAIKPFTAGLVCELENDGSAAASLFQNAINICSDHLENDSQALVKMKKLIEECLVRMTHCYISNEDYPAALTTLGILCEILPSYIVSYAKMLNLCGKQDFAIELLESYTELYPTHKKASFVLEGIKPTAKSANDGHIDDPAYVDKISGVMNAMTGRKPDDQAA